VSIAFPIEVAGIDLNGQRFAETTRTTTVSRYGCCLASSHPLKLDQTIDLRRIGNRERMIGRIVAPMGLQPEGQLYGVGTTESCEGLWGIRFSSSVYGKLMDNLHEGVYFVNRERKITCWNDGAEQVSGYAAGEAIGKHCFNNFLGHVDESGRSLCKDGCPLTQVMADGLPREANIYLRHKDGYRVPVSVRALPMMNAAGTIVGAVEVFTDATPGKKAEKRVIELEQLAFRDPITGLPNRRYLEMQVEQGLEAHRRFGRRYGLLLFDVDGFNRLNDRYGHDLGDRVLKVVAETLVRSLGTEDIVGRWDGEEFLVLVTDLDAVALCERAEHCRIMISRSSVIAGASRVSVTTSVGATVLSPSDGATSALQRVGDLMHKSKQSGGGRTTAG
jgi:diguanylate cyclase (GGDEF)-like protein/PAS domain S-box-containing protein